ncbi:MAG TPA: ATP-binding protein [Anaerolineales bacterium]|nr:ATP-binding protein [Anaerolineales bacterium]
MEELTSLLTTPAGVFFHQLSITLILFGTIIVVFGRNASETNFPAGRMLLGLAVLVAFRLGLSVAALFQVAAGGDAVLLPVLERGLSTASVAVLVWLWAFPERNRTGDAAALILTSLILVLTVAGLGAGLQTVPQAAAWLTGPMIWAALSIVIGAAGLLLLVRLRPPVWGYGVSLLLVLIMGEVAGLAIGSPAEIATGILRLSQIAALPVLLTLPQRIIPAAFSPPAPVPPVVRPTPERKRVNLPSNLFADFMSLGLEGDMLSVCRKASEIVSYALVADICLVVSRPTSSDEILIFCGFDQVLEHEIGGAQISARHLPMIASAIQKHAPLRLPASSASSDLKFLSSTLRLPKSGHLLVAPIRTKQPSELGALILLTPYSSRNWTQEDQIYLARAAEGLAAILDQAQLLANHEDVLRGIERDLEETRERNRQMETVLQQLKTQPGSSPETGEPAGEVVSFDHPDTEAAVRQTLEEELETLREAHDRLAAELDDRNWEQTVQHLQAENIQLQLAVDELETDLEDLHNRTENFKRAREETLAVVEKLTAENRALAEELEMITGSAGRSSENGNLAGAGTEASPDQLRTALAEIAQLRSKVGETEIKLVELENLAASGTHKTGQWDAVISLAEEMRQPMSSILGYSDFLLTESVGLLGALQRKFMERVKSSTTRMSAMVEDLIHIAALESGKMKLSLGKVDLNNLIDSAISSAAIQIREKNVALRVNLPDDLPIIEGDREAIRLTLVHLLLNAAAATPIQGEIAIEIAQERGEADDDFVRISVSDTGTGIAPEQIEAVFDRRGKSRGRAIPGLGISGSGLSIARTLVEAHGGRIWIESVSGTGTTFAILLPVRREISETPFASRGF